MSAVPEAENQMRSSRRRPAMRVLREVSEGTHVPIAPVKTPLTRKNLQDAESRYQELESLLEQCR